jgi:hypothetical protein
LPIRPDCDATELQSHSTADQQRYLTDVLADRPIPSGEGNRGNKGPAQLVQGLGYSLPFPCSLDRLRREWQVIPIGLGAPLEHQRELEDERVLAGSTDPLLEGSPALALRPVG